VGCSDVLHQKRSIRYSPSTSSVYDWGSRTATMPTPLADYLARKGAEFREQHFISLRSAETRRGGALGIYTYGCELLR
jgi:hypothetical protein